MTDPVKPAVLTAIGYPSGMKMLYVTEVARNFSAVMNRIEIDQEEVTMG